MKALLKPEIRFEEEGHKYFLGKREVPGLSKILQKVGLTKSYAWIDPWYAERGKAVHKAIELDLRKDLDESSLDPVLAPFLSAWRMFVKEVGYKAKECERVYFSEAQDYACTIDHYGILKGWPTLIDVKCTNSHDKGADFQLCGQAFAMEERGNPVVRMGILELHDDSKYDYFPYEVDVFIMPAIMRLYRRKIGL